MHVYMAENWNRLRQACYSSHGNAASFIVSLAGSVLHLEFAFAEPLPQSQMACLNRIKQRFHAVGLERYHPAINVPTEVSYHLIEPAQAFRSQEGI
jgi:hypothetical protein